MSTMIQLPIFLIISMKMVCQEEDVVEEEEEVEMQNETDLKLWQHQGAEAQVETNLRWIDGCRL